MTKKKVLLVVGTRPEAIKMAPLYLAMKERQDYQVQLCVTAQHREMLDSILHLFAMKPDIDLNLMRPGQSLHSLTSRILESFTEVLITQPPQCVFVHGDTTTAMAAAMAAFYQKIPAAHVEAGLRTGDLMAPWPEEMNRRAVSVFARLHFCPTAAAKNHLVREGISNAGLFVTGNTVIDALFLSLHKIKSNPDMLSALDRKFRFLSPERKLILVTAHRRENFGPGFVELCESLRELAADPDVEIVYPVHPNPQVKKAVESTLLSIPRVHLLEPQEYLPFVYLMNRSHFIITDSGGVQEEAPSLGKPVLVAREVTERPEAVEAGTVILVGTSKEKILAESRRLLMDPSWYKKMAESHNPYGDGHAVPRILEALEGEFAAPLWSSKSH